MLLGARVASLTDKGCFVALCAGEVIEMEAHIAVFRSGVIASQLSCRDLLKIDAATILFYWLSLCDLES